MNRQNSNILAIILAAGKGTRMKRKMPKPLVNVNGKPIISWIIDSFIRWGIDIALVINPEHEILFQPYKKYVKIIHQKDQLGTAHAVIQAYDTIEGYDNSFVFVGDSPFVGYKLIRRMLDEHSQKGSDLTILSSVFEERSFPYARIVRDDKDNINKVVEEVDASDKEFLINELFCSHYLFKSEILREYLPLIKKNINTREINLTEIINKLILNDKIINVISVDDWNRLVGLNTFEDIKWAESQKIK